MKIDISEFEQKISDDIIESLIKRPETWKRFKIEKSFDFIQRTDGLVISTDEHYVFIKQPATYWFVDKKINAKLTYEVKIWVKEEQTQLRERKRQEAQDTLVDFFHIDKKIERKKKLKKLNENE